MPPHFCWITGSLVDLTPAQEEVCVPPLNGALFTRPCVTPLQKAEGGGAAEALHERPGEAERGKRQKEGKKGKMKDKEEQVG